LPTEKQDGLRSLIFLENKNVDMRIIIIFLVFILSATSAYSQKEKKRIRQGNTEYEEGNFSEAEKEYRKALMEKPGYTKGTFNLGDAMYEQENYEESNKLFTEVTERITSPEEKASAYYNLGNTYMKENKFQESIDAYKNSLRLNPNDPDAKYNLEYARKKLKEQQQNQDQNQDQDKKDQDKKDQDKKDQDKKDQEKKDQDKENKDQDKKDQEKKDQNNGDQKKDQQKQEPQKISKQDAQRMLDALNNDEKKTLQKLQKQKAEAIKGKKSDIDW
jgi:tetratricopeptide (TPR) repeat protein